MAGVRLVGEHVTVGVELVTAARPAARLVQGREPTTYRQGSYRGVGDGRATKRTSDAAHAAREARPTQHLVNGARPLHVAHAEVRGGRVDCTLGTEQVPVAALGRAASHHVVTEISH